MLNPTTGGPVDTAVDRGTEALMSRRSADGVFAPAGDRYSPANTGAALVALHLVGGDASPGSTARAVRRLCETQRPDGGWAMTGVPSEPLATTVVTTALRLTAPEEAAKAITAGRKFLDRSGGPDAMPEPAMAGLMRQFDALTGLVDEATLPRLPLELLLLRGPARRLLSLRLPIFAALALGQSAHRRRGPVGERLNALARPAALSVLRQAYEREGSTGGFSTDPWLTALVLIGVARSGLAPDIARAAARWLRSTARPDGTWDLMPLDITWSTFAGAALLEAGRADDPRLTPTWEMFRARQQDVPFAALDCPAGYWGFSSDRSWPMALETAEVSSALRRIPGGASDPHVRDGVGWLTAMQDRAGSWSLAVRGSKPGGFGPCPQMTAKAVVALLDCRVPAADRRVTRALTWLAGEQHADGSYEALWYRGRTAGTSVVLEAYCRAGAADSTAVSRAREWLLRTRREDGSWGAGDDGGPGTVEDTAWALYALLAAGVPPHDAAVADAGRWLAAAQLPDGGWPAAPVNEYIRRCFRYADDVIAAGLAVRALARLRTESARGGQA